MLIFILTKFGASEDLIEENFVDAILRGLFKDNLAYGLFYLEQPSSPYLES